MVYAKNIYIQLKRNRKANEQTTSHCMSFCRYFYNINELILSRIKKNN